MRFIEKYQAAPDSLLHAVRQKKQAGRLSAFGYASNLDLLCAFQGEELSRFLSAELSGTAPEAMRPAGRITNARELAETVLYYCRNGLGGEADIENTELLAGLVDVRKAIGGSGAQASLALSAVGGSCLVHLTDASEDVLRLLSAPGILKLGTDCQLCEVSEAQGVNEAEPHYIIQYQKGDRIRVGDTEIVIPLSNRLILTKFTINDRLPLDPAVLRWIEEHAAQVPSLMISGFNCITDVNILRPNLDAVLAHLKRYRRNNPEGIVYYENGDFHGDELRRTVLRKLLPGTDIVGMNEEELRDALESAGERPDPEDIFACIRGVQLLTGRFGIRKGMVIHTKDYAMYVGRPPAADIEAGLMYGNLMAAAKALHGYFGTEKEIREVLTLGLSEKGMNFREQVRESAYRDQVVLVPTRYIDSPKHTIGLGDAFTAGVQICFQ